MEKSFGRVKSNNYNGGRTGKRLKSEDGGGLFCPPAKMIGPPPRREAQRFTLLSFWGSVKSRGRGKEGRKSANKAPDAVNERTHYETNVIAKRRGGFRL